jgi:hypothetical protein
MLVGSIILPSVWVAFATIVTGYLTSLNVRGSNGILIYVEGSLLQSLLNESTSTTVSN